MKKLAIQTNDPNTIGEYLRNVFFDQTKGKGCYDSFDVTENTLTLPTQLVDPEYDSITTWNIFQKDVNFNDKVEKVIMRYYWDGDGTLEFIFDDNSSVLNTDCKKTYNWKWKENADTPEYV